MRVSIIRPDMEEVNPRHHRKVYASLAYFYQVVEAQSMAAPARRMLYSLE